MGALLKQRDKIYKHVLQLMDNKEPIKASEICKQYKISDSSFYNIMKERGLKVAEYNKQINDNAKKEEPVNIDSVINKKMPSEKFIVKVESDKVKSTKKNAEKLLGKELAENIIIEENSYNGDTLYDYSPIQSNTVTAALISKRHEFIDNSGNPYIYQGPVKADIIHNYDKLQEIAEKFLDDYVISAGCSRLRVIITGLTQCAVCVIKACYEHNISLTFLHYDNVTGRYNEQVVFGKDGEKKENSLLSLYGNTKRYYKYKLINHDANYYHNIKSNLYMIKVENLSEINSTVVTCYVTDDMNTMFRYYAEEVKKVKDEKFISYRVLADEIAFGSTNMEYQFIQTYGSFFNMPKKN